MTDEIKEVGSFRVETDGGTITLIPEHTTTPTWRNLDRKKEGIVPDELLKDYFKIAMNLTKPYDDGKRIGKYHIFMTTISPNPKSSQGALKSFYKEAIIENLKKKEEFFMQFNKQFNKKEILLYVAVYLRKDRYEKNDVDNFIKVIVDSLKPFIGDDSRIVSILAEKKLLGNYPKEDYDFLEQVFILIADPDAKKDIFKSD